MAVCNCHRYDRAEQGWVCLVHGVQRKARPVMRVRVLNMSPQEHETLLALERRLGIDCLELERMRLDAMREGYRKACEAR